MGDKAGARSIIDEVIKDGSPAQKNQAAELEAQLG
jgi:FimV-like protein